MSARNALSFLLRNSGLTSTEENGRVRIVAATPLVRSAQREELSSSSPMTSSSDVQSSVTREGVASEDLRVVVVTAEKRTELLQDVPIPVTALSAASLVSNGELRIQDYYSSVPGFSVSPANEANQILAIRSRCYVGRKERFMGLAAWAAW
jgi:iron complex outermembrane receptor protein